MEPGWPVRRVSTLGKGLFRVRADGASQPQLLMRSRAFLRPWSFTPDGKRLTYFETYLAKQQIFTLPLVDQDGVWKGGEPELFSTSTNAERLPSFSPDGRWLAYDSDESGRVEGTFGRFHRRRPGKGASGKSRTAAAPAPGGPGVVLSSCTDRVTR